MPDAFPETNEKELKLIADVTNGTLFPTSESVSMLWAELEDAQDHYYDKWDVEKNDLVRRVQQWSSEECRAVLNWCDKFWAENA
jgi:hypothetical protein